MAYVYILRSLKNNRFYIGSTTDIDRRLYQHNLGNSSYTKNNRPFVLLLSQEYSTLIEARKVELWLKKQKSKILIERIIKERKIRKILNAT